MFDISSSAWFTLFLRLPLRLLLFSPLAILLRCTDYKTKLPLAVLESKCIVANLEVVSDGDQVAVLIDFKLCHRRFKDVGILGKGSINKKGKKDTKIGGTHPTPCKEVHFYPKYYVNLKKGQTPIRPNSFSFLFIELFPWGLVELSQPPWWYVETKDRIWGVSTMS